MKRDIKELCKHVIDMNINHAIASIQEDGCTHRITGDGSKILLENITSDFVENRINLRVDRNIVKHARVG